MESSSNENAKQVTSASGRHHPTPRFMSLGGLCVEASDSGCSMSSGNIKVGGDIYVGQRCQGFEWNIKNNVFRRKCHNNIGVNYA
ncbi:MAG: hypothetical protein J7K72_04120 [Candidatus Aenigmarchaeota archaeon]|nr:hypothetical protein [Candidatus Aenigmarchaeota archaeon]